MVRASVQRRSPVRSSAAFLAALLAGCYVYTPIQTPAPAPQDRVALVLTDQGRVGAGATMGAGLARVEGKLIGSTDSDYTLRVAEVVDIRGAVSRWSEETVTLQRGWVSNAYERRLSKSRTYLLAGALAAGFVAFVASRTLFGSGGPVVENPPGGGGGQQ
jgi:hypothetical protein